MSSNNVASLEEFVDGHTPEEPDNEEETDDDDIISIDYDWGDHSLNVDHDTPRNICPACMAPSPPKDDDDYAWECDNDECGLLGFCSGWFDQQKKKWDDSSDFLYSIDWVEVMESLHERGIKASPRTCRGTGDPEIYSGGSPDDEKSL